MSKVNRTWTAVVAAALLLGTLVGAVWARPADQQGAAESTRKVTIAGDDFIPTADDWDYTSVGPYVSCASGICGFNAPIVFPTLNAVTVERIKLHVNDTSAGATATASFYRTNPSTGANAGWATISSPTGSSGGLRTYTSDPINKVVWPSQRAYVQVNIGATGILVYGVTIEYHVGS